MKEENPWISVDDERKPKPGERVRIFTTRPEESHDHWLGEKGWDGNFSENVTHWQRIVGPKQPEKPVMVEAPNKENMGTFDCDPDPTVQAHSIVAQKLYLWWNNPKGRRLWYWHNGEWNRAI